MIRMDGDDGDLLILEVGAAGFCGAFLGELRVSDNDGITKCSRQEFLRAWLTSAAKVRRSFVVLEVRYI